MQLGSLTWLRTSTLETWSNSQYYTWISIANLFFGPKVCLPQRNSRDIWDSFVRSQFLGWIGWFVTFKKFVIRQFQYYISCCPSFLRSLSDFSSSLDSSSGVTVWNWRVILSFSSTWLWTYDYPGNSMSCLVIV